MPSVNVSEDDFDAVAGAAMDAKRRGDPEGAQALDKLARKINAALSNSNSELNTLRLMTGRARSTLSWKEMPSVINGPAAGSEPATKPVPKA